MNSAVIGLITLAWLVGGYFLYGRRIQKRLIEPDDSRPTPAVTQRDDVDFKEAPRVVLFGHHFSSIAGAGPIVGPILAVAFFGWGLSLIWILVGVVFLGAVHDYLALMVSVRNRGRSIPDIARDVVGERSRMLFQIFVWLTLVLVIAAFIDVAADSFIKDPRIVLPAFGLLPLATLFGWAVYRGRVPLVFGTLVALGALGGLIFLGERFPLAFHEVPPASSADAMRVLSLGLDVETARILWYAVLSLYGLAASVLPVWLLLQPRDYIANWILVVGMVLGFTGLFIAHPPIRAEFFTSASTAKGPVWPMLFIIIACGAISGFHALVASGTTAKQLARERQGLLVGYGAMLTEGALAVLALLAVAAGMSSETLHHVLTAKQGGGPVVAFAQGFGEFAAPITGSAFGFFFGATMINAFVITSLDTSVRLARFITAEGLGEKVPWLGNRVVASLLAVVPAFLLVVSGSKSVLWPMFASANQLVGGLTLIVLSAYLVGMRKPSRYTVIPAIFMLITTMAALCFQVYKFLIDYDPAKGPNVLLGAVAALLLVLSVIVARDAATIIGRGGLRSTPVQSGGAPTR